MDTNLTVGVAIPLILPGATNASAPTPKAAAPAAPLPGHSAGSPSSPSSIEAQRHEAVIQAAKNYPFKDSYVVGDTTFSIYKDNSGQYITRYISLRDGRVTYIPEPQLLMFQQAQSRASSAALKINA